MNKPMIITALVLVLLTLGSAFAEDDCYGPCEGSDLETPTLDVEECLVRINDRLVKNDVVVLKAFERGEELEIRIEFVSRQMAEDVQVMAWLTGYHRGHRFPENIFDITPTFDVDPNVAYEKTLNLKLPDDFDLSSGDELKIRIEISDKFASSYIREFNLKVEAQRHSIIVQDIILDPAEEVQAGRGLFVSARLKNMGEKDEDSIKLIASIPSLNLRATEYIDELEADDATTSEDMFLRIPSCTEPGDYVVVLRVEYADGDETITEEAIVTVTADPLCEKDVDQGTDKTVVTVPGKQDVVIGTSGTVYPVIIENNGLTDRTYEFKATGLDTWATYRFDPSSLVLVKAGDSETVYLYVTAKADAVQGEKVFMVTVETLSDKKQIALTANVVAGETPSPFGDLGNLRSALLVGVIVLIVLIVVLALVVGFSRMKGPGKEGEEEVSSGQTYY